MTSSQRQRSGKGKTSGAIIPGWMFDIHEDDDDTGDNSLLQELEIDLPIIFRCIIYMMLCPLRGVTRISALGVHPLTIVDTDVVKKTASGSTRTSPSNSNKQQYRHDFWGPCAVVTLYGLLLSLGSGRDVSWVYVVWCGSAIFMHLICRVWCDISTFSLHFAVIGYSISPMIFPMSLLILVLKPVRWISFLLEAMAVILASHAAFCSYRHVCKFTPAEATRSSLLILPIVVTNLYFMSLLPIDAL